MPRLPHHPIPDRSPSKRTRGFSLPELLIVVAVIGLLAALLLPALSRSKAKTAQLQCSSQLRQLGIAARMYAGDYGGRGIFQGSPDVPWMETLGSYYANSGFIRLCPQATASQSDSPESNPGTARSAWSWKLGGRSHLGSYAMNGWMYSYEAASAWQPDRGGFFQIESAITQPGSTPMFLDSVWIDLWPKASDRAADDLSIGDYKTLGIGRSSIARHGSGNSLQTAAINLFCMDGHVETARLETLLSQYSWHRGYPARTQLLRPSGR